MYPGSASVSDHGLLCNLTSHPLTPVPPTPCSGGTYRQRPAHTLRLEAVCLCKFVPWPMWFPSRPSLVPQPPASLLPPKALSRTSSLPRYRNMHLSVLQLFVLFFCQNRTPESQGPGISSCGDQYPPPSLVAFRPFPRNAFMLFPENCHVSSMSLPW